MRHIELLNTKYERLCFIDNDAPGALHYIDDKLTTTIDSGVYTLDMKIPKDTQLINYVREGNFIHFYNNQDVHLLMQIRTIDDVSVEYKQIYCEDGALTLSTSLAKVITKPTVEQTIQWYLNESLEETGFKIGLINLDTTIASFEYSSEESVLSRIKKIASDFNAEFYFSADISNGKAEFYVNLVKSRIESTETFRLSTDDFVSKIDRKVNLDNVITRLIVRGATTNDKTASTPSKTPTTQDVPAKDDLVEKLVAIGMSKLGAAYLWGGNGPTRFDCSGFCNYCYRQAGYTTYPSIRCTSQYIWSCQHPSLSRVSPENRQRGDMVLMDTGYTFPGDANHIGIYIGDGQMMHYGDPGHVANVSKYKVIGYVRVKKP